MVVFVGCSSAGVPVRFIAAARGWAGSGGALETGLQGHGTCRYGTCSCSSSIDCRRTRVMLRAYTLQPKLPTVLHSAL